MNPFELSGPAFLWFFVVAGLVAAAAAIVLRWLVARPLRPGDPEAIARALHPTEVAFLVGDLDRAVEAAIAGLHHRGAIEIETGTLVVRDRPAIEGEGVYRGVPAAPRGRSLVEDYVLSRLPARASRLCEEARDSHLPIELRAKLEEQGLLVGRAGWLVRLPGLIWIATGALKLAIGIARARPISLLFLLMLAGVPLFLILARPPHLTRLGRAVVRELTSLTALETTARTAPQQLSDGEMSLAYAVFGHGVAPAAVMAIMPSFHAETASLQATSASAASGGSTCGSSTCASFSSGGSGGSSCSSGGSSCGSSCGGGGGGCGGCS